MALPFPVPGGLPGACTSGFAMRSVSRIGSVLPSPFNVGFCQILLRNGEVSGYGGIGSTLKVLEGRVGIDGWCTCGGESRGDQGSWTKETPCIRRRGTGPKGARCRGLVRFEMKQGFSAGHVPVSTHSGSYKNLTDLKGTCVSRRCLKWSWLLPDACCPGNWPV